jgi:hypothetical protein
VSVGLVVEIIGDASRLSSELGKAEGKVGGFASGIGGTALKVGAMVGVVGIAAGVVSELTNAAAEDQAEQLRLQAALEAAGVATGDYTAKVDEAIAAGQERAFTDSQTREALQSLVTATGDLDTATASLTMAQDIARFANVDLATAADAVAKAQAGQDGALRKLMPGLAKGATATDTLKLATDQASGSADAYASSAQGMQDRAGDAFGELTETIGSVFLPILEELLPAILPIIRSLAKIVEQLLPAFKVAINIILIPIKLLTSMLSGAVDILAELVGWISDAIGALGRFFDSINPFKDVKLPSLPFMSSAPAGASSSRAGVGRGVGRAGVGAGMVGPAPTINVYTTGDGIEAEQAVVRALRRVTRLNGGVVPALGWAPSS